MGIVGADDQFDSDKDATDPVRRALNALEGKFPSSPRNSFGMRVSTVEIPDFDATEKLDWSERQSIHHSTSSTLPDKSLSLFYQPADL